MATLYWITGLPGAGKTTIGRLLFEHLKAQHVNTVFLDGDELRKILGVGDQAYSEQERKQLALQYARICRLLVDQDINVVCATVSMFNEVRDWNRQQIAHYCEIYLNVQEEILHQRDQKNLYSRARSGEEQQLVGQHLCFEEPTQPDVIIVNDGQLSPKAVVADLINKIF